MCPHYKYLHEEDTTKSAPERSSEVAQSKGRRKEEEREGAPARDTPGDTGGLAMGANQLDKKEVIQLPIHGDAHIPPRTWSF